MLQTSLGDASNEMGEDMMRTLALILFLGDWNMIQAFVTYNNII